MCLVALLATFSMFGSLAFSSYLTDTQPSYPRQLGRPVPKFLVSQTTALLWSTCLFPASGFPHLLTPTLHPINPSTQLLAKRPLSYMPNPLQSQGRETRIQPGLSQLASSTNSCVPSALRFRTPHPRRNRHPLQQLVDSFPHILSAL